MRWNPCGSACAVMALAMLPTCVLGCQTSPGDARGVLQAVDHVLDEHTPALEDGEWKHDPALVKASDEWLDQLATIARTSTDTSERDQARHKAFVLGVCGGQPEVSIELCNAALAEPQVWSDRSMRAMWLLQRAQASVRKARMEPASEAAREDALRMQDEYIEDVLGTTANEADLSPETVSNIVSVLGVKASLERAGGEYRRAIAARDRAMALASAHVASQARRAGLQPLAFESARDAARLDDVTEAIGYARLMRELSGPDVLVSRLASDVLGNFTDPDARAAFASQWLATELPKDDAWVEFSVRAARAYASTTAYAPQVVPMLDELEHDHADALAARERRLMKQAQLARIWALRTLGSIGESVRLGAQFRADYADDAAVLAMLPREVREAK